MNNITLNKNHTLLVFFLSLFFYLYNLKFDFEILPLICFFLIATIGVSHGALDHQKGKKLLKNMKIKNMGMQSLSLNKILFSIQKMKNHTCI